MYRLIKIWISCVIVTSALLVACAKGSATADDGGVHTPTPNDVVAPVITITAPFENQDVPSGTTLNITGLITDDYGLYQGSVRIINNANGFELLKQAYIIHGIRSYNFSLSFNHTVTTVTNCTVIVSFEDHGSNTATKQVSIKISP
jgi:phosphate-selective porin